MSYILLFLHTIHATSSDSNKKFVKKRDGLAIRRHNDLLKEIAENVKLAHMCHNAKKMTVSLVKGGFMK